MIHCIMAKKPWYKEAAFLEERRKWYAKLKKKGFKDIEYFDRKTGDALPVLNGYSSMDAVRFYREDAAEFYRLAEQFTRKVGNKYGKRSWECKAWGMYAQGVGVAKISKTLDIPLSRADKLLSELKQKMLTDCDKFVANDTKWK